MNQTTHAIFTLLHYSILLRDTLEYTLGKPDSEYSVDVYNERKRVLLGTLDNPSQLKEFLTRNGETGQKIDGQLREFIDDIYGADSTVIRVGSEGLRVDQSQHLRIFQYVFGLYETISDIIYGHINHAKTNNLLDNGFEKAVEVNNKFYRTLAYMILVKDLNKTFKEFNDAMRETKGEASPQSNFIANDLGQIVSYLGFVRAHSQYDRNQPKADQELIDMYDATENVIAKMSGRVAVSEGENLFKTADENLAKITALVGKHEKLNMESLQALFKDATDFITELRKSAPQQA